MEAGSKKSNEFLLELTRGLRTDATEPLPDSLKRLHWEAIAIAQVLYLEAEAAGVRSTGMGCFFDDTMHQIVGLTDHRYQDLYHFTVGGAVDDPRLRDAPAYAHREQSLSRR